MSLPMSLPARNVPQRYRMILSLARFAEPDAPSPIGERWVQFSENIAGALAYFTFIPATPFLSLNPYNKNRFVRFHSLQCLYAWGACALVGVFLRVVALFLFLIPAVGALIVWVIFPLAALAAALAWFVVVIKALQGEILKLPIIGNLADRQSES